MREQISPEPIDWGKVNRVAGWIRIAIDVDNIEAHENIKGFWKVLSNDERIAVCEQLTDKAPDSGPRGKMYKSILKEYLAYVPDP